VPLVLSNTVLFLYEQIANIRSRKFKVVVSTMTGIPSENTNTQHKHRLHRDIVGGEMLFCHPIGWQQFLIGVAEMVSGFGEDGQ